MAQETNTNTTSLRAVAVAAVPPGLREHLLAWAAENGVVTADDAFWPLAAALINSLGAAKAAGDAAAKVATAVGSIQNEIYAGTQRAATDLAAGVAKGIEDKTAEAGAALVQAIGVAASRGAQELQRTAAGLDKLGQEKGAAFVESWKNDLARAVAAQAKSSLAWRLGKGYGIVAGALLVMMFLGAAIMFGFEMVEHKIIVSPNAQWRGHEVVFTSPSVYRVKCAQGVCFSSRPQRR
jgi:hypothetical protein